MKTIKLGNVEVGEGFAPYIIAEVGSNHNGDMNLCKKLVHAATKAGAHAVKFQSWSEKSLISEEEYKRNTEYSDKKKHFGSLLEMVKTYQLKPEQHYEALKYCQESNIEFCSTPFSIEEVDMLEKLNVPFFKIASMDIVNLPFLKYVSGKMRPMIISTGMSTLAEIEMAIETVYGTGNKQVALLHCVSIYPPEYEMLNLRNICSLRNIFDVPVGFSDHTLGTAIPIASVSLGACIIEKHFTINKDMEGWDHAISADPVEMKYITEQSLNVFNALGGGKRVVTQVEIEKREKFRRSLVARGFLPKGHQITEKDLDAKRPGTGISPNELKYVVGRKINVDIEKDQVIQWDKLY